MHNISISCNPTAPRFNVDALCFAPIPSCYATSNHFENGQALILWNLTPHLSFTAIKQYESKAWSTCTGFNDTAKVKTQTISQIRTMGLCSSHTSKTSQIVQITSIKLQQESIPDVCANFAFNINSSTHHPSAHNTPHKSKRLSSSLHFLISSRNQ